LHYQGVRHLDEEVGEPSEVNFCSAFPDGIPDEIAYGSNLHTKPFPGDHGFLYEESIQEEA
jgi:hypothetical protein